MKLFRPKDFAFKAKFARVAPAASAKSVDIPLGWFVVHYNHIPAKADRRIAHGEWFAIKSDKTTIYRMLRFSPRAVTEKGETPAGIVIDWIGWIDLHDRSEDVDGPLVLDMRRLFWWERPRAYLNHPDTAIRFSGWLGWISLILGIISLFLTLPYDWLGDQADAFHKFLSNLRWCSR